ncbi:hypothetical protein FHG87_012812, partial [Trinorchestia longiramus]
MVAGGVQSVEEGDPYEGYQPANAYYQHLYAAFLRGEASPPYPRHPNCTCPVPPPPPLAALPNSVPITPLSGPSFKHPKCTCPSPSSSFPPSPSGSLPPSPIPLRRTARCGQRSYNSSPHLSYMPMASARHPKCTCPIAPTVAPVPSPVRCTCPDTDQSKSKLQKKRRPLRAVLLDAPDRTPILSTDRHNFIKLHHTSDSLTTTTSPIQSPILKKKLTQSITSSPVLVHRLQDGSPTITSNSQNSRNHQEFPDITQSTLDSQGTHNGKVMHNSRSSSPNADEITVCNSATSVPTTPISSPARKMKEKLSTLRDKVVSSFIRSSSFRNKDSDDTGGFGEEVI